MKSGRFIREGHEDFLLGVISPESMETNHTGVWRWLRPEIVDKACNGCGNCVLFCPDFCISLKNKKIAINYTYCKGCGICAYECKRRAIIMRIE